MHLSTFVYICLHPFSVFPFLACLHAVTQYRAFYFKKLMTKLAFILTWMKLKSPKSSSSHANSHLQMSTTHTLRKLPKQKSCTLIECEESSVQKTSPPVIKKCLVDYPFMMIQSNAHAKTVDVAVVKKWKSRKVEEMAANCGFLGCNKLFLSDCVSL